MKYYLLAALLISSSPCLAQYKCVVNGTASYQERPCSQASKPLDLPGDTPVSAEERAQAKARFLRQKAVADGYDYQHGVEQIDINRRSAAVERENAQRKKRCADLLQTAKDAQNEADTYRHHGGLIDDARRRKREAEAAHFSECYAR